MTLAAPKSRQGKFVLVLAFLATVVAVLGVLAWSTTARADLPTTTVTLSQSPATTATSPQVAPGDTVTYTMDTTTTGVNDNGVVVMTINLGSGLVAATSGGTCPATGTGGAGITWTLGGDGTAVLTCTSSVVLTAAMTNAIMTAFALVNATNIGTGTGDVQDVDANPEAAVADSTVGPLTVGSMVVDATNFPGEPHIFDFTLAAGVTCENDPTDTNDAVDCVDADVVIAGAAGCAKTAGPTVTDADLADESFVSVTIDGGTGIEGDCTVTLAITYVGPDEDVDTDWFDLDDAVATKSFDVGEAAGEIRHLDEPDVATEDAADDDDSDPQEDWCDAGSVTGTCGILTPRDDPDDATGSFHQACIINGSLTHANDSGFITWSIVAVAGSPLPTAVSITEVAGPHDAAAAEPCVRWGSGYAGTQNITAVYDNGTGPAITYYWDGYCVEGGDCTAVEDADTHGVTEPVDDVVVPLALVKEWNDLDNTLLINVTGNVGDTLAANTLELDDWAARDCTLAGFCARTDRDGTTIAKTGVVIAGPVKTGYIDAAGVSFIDYTMGSHSSGPSDAYDGPVDGAAQTYTLDAASDCGSVRLEDPTTGAVKILKTGQMSANVLSSDKGVGLQIVPNDAGAIETVPANADCLPGAEVCVTIATEEDNDFGSPPLDDVADEHICVQFVGGSIGNKHPDLAWAGQRKSLDADWRVESVVAGETVFECPWADAQSSFYVRYVQHAGSPGLLSDDLGAGTSEGQDFMTVQVQVDAAVDADGIILPNTGCRSSVLYETEGEGQVDVSAFVVSSGDDGSVVSDEIDFLIFYMKFYDIVVTPSADQSVNVSEGTEVTSTVRGWTVTNSSNCAVLAAVDDLPAGRCVFPDDWVTLAAGEANRGEDSVPVATVDRPEWDLWGGSTAADCTTAAGPLSMLDTDGCSTVAIPTGVAPHVGTPVQRDTIFSDGNITPDDAPMPPALMKFELVNDTNGVVCATNPATAALTIDGCSGFIKTVDSTADQFDTTHIPAEAWIPPTTGGVPPQGYSWNTWGPAGQPKTGLYNFWTDLAQSGDEVISCGGENPCTDGVATGGYKWIGVYTDNHGVAKATVFGDADLTFNDCATTGAAAGGNIVFVDGVYCESGDEVGTASLVARADYPDKRKHPQIRSDEVDFTFTWGGIKEVNIVDGLTDQFHYVVFHVTDRDGYCGATPEADPLHVRLHPVLGERVTFLIESGEGIIYQNENSIPAALLGTVTEHDKKADVTTFDTGDTANATLTQTVVVDDECQAWIHVSSSLIDEVDVLIQAFDPEGTVTFDVIVNPPATPTPTPTTEPTPTATPANQLNLWADIDCSGGVNPVDSLKILRADAGKSVAQGADCPDPKEDLTVIWDGLTTNDEWGDADCSGELDPIDSLKVLRFDAGLFYIQQEPCPDIGAEVLIPQQ